MKTITATCLLATAILLGSQSTATADDYCCGNNYSYPIYFPGTTYYSPPRYYPPPVYYTQPYSYYTTVPQYGFYYGYYPSPSYYYRSPTPYTYRYRSTYRRQW